MDNTLDRLYNYMDKQRTIAGRYSYNDGIAYYTTGPLALAVLHGLTILAQPNLLWQDVECNTFFVWCSFLFQSVLAAALVSEVI